MCFTKWHKWTERSYIEGVQFPGVYVIAKSDTDISGIDFSWIKEIIYIGMTNSQGGLKQRLQQFDNTINFEQNGKGHGGADRVALIHRDYNLLKTTLFVSVYSIDCGDKKLTSKKLKKMGKVAKAEYDCLARFFKAYKELPEFNDKTRSPKRSLEEKKKKNKI